MSDNAPIGVAIIGSGIFAREEHLPAVLATPQLSLKAIYSRTLKSASALSANLAQKVDWYSEETEGRGLDEMLTNSNIKAVIIALPITAQPYYIKAALTAGKHVLSEKPIAKDVATAQDLVGWYRQYVDATRVTWSIAENWRFLDSHKYAAEQVSLLGRVIGFRVKVNRNVQPGNKYFETAWRKTPQYQGGFLLDSCPHFVAALRLMIGPDDPIERVAAFTAQLQEHLPPVDTVNATLRTKAGISGTFAVSMGTTFKGNGFAIACERGTVTTVMNRVTVQKDGQESPLEFANEGSGVKQEVKAWAEGIEHGMQDPRLMPEEGLKDLEIVSFQIHSQSGRRSLIMPSR